MNTSKLLRTLKTLSSKEFKTFEKKAINHFNKKDKLVVFIKFIAKNYPEFDDNKISKEKIFKAIYKNEKYFDIRIRELMSLTFKYLKEFLISLETKESYFYYQFALLKQYNKRKLENLYQAQLKVVKNILKKDKFKNKEYFKREYLVANIEYEHYSKKNIVSLDTKLQTKTDNLDFYYISTKLQETCDMLNRQKILNQKYNFHLFDEITNLIEKHKNDYLNHPFIICYYEVYKLLKTDNDTSQLKRCINTLKENSKNFIDKEIKNLFDFPQNYCIANMNKGKLNYIQILFDLQKDLINENFILVNGYISQVSYVNIVTLALKLKKYKWAKEFNEKYQEKVEPEYRENTYNMNLANLYYSSKEYSKTLGLLNQIEFTDVYYASYSKIILLKTYYALKEYETLFYFITAFRLFLKRNKELSSNFKTNTDLFLTYFKKILTIADKINFIDTQIVNSKLKELENNIKTEKSILNRIWLLEIIEKLK